MGGRASDHARCPVRRCIRRVAQSRRQHLHRVVRRSLPLLHFEIVPVEFAGSTGSEPATDQPGQKFPTRAGARAPGAFRVRKCPGTHAFHFQNSFTQPATLSAALRLSDLILLHDPPGVCPRGTLVPFVLLVCGYEESFFPLHNSGDGRRAVRLRAASGK